MSKDRAFHIRPSLAGQTLGSALRQLLKTSSWTEIKRLIASRHVQINGNLCLDDARRLKTDDILKVFQQARAPLPKAGDIRVVYRDSDLVVIDKPAGLTTLRHSQEQDWPEKKKDRAPTLEELLERQLNRAHDSRQSKPGKNRKFTIRSKPIRVRPVHRLDRDTSGLMLFALSPAAEQKLIALFKQHAIQRLYRAVVHGRIDRAQTLETWMVRDRGDGLRGSGPLGKNAPESQRAITHVRPVQFIGDAYTIIECRLETGRTHQIRIHLSEIGHMLCGEKIYTRPAPHAQPVKDASGAPRHALHSCALEFEHPITGQRLRFDSAWPKEMANWLKRLQAANESTTDQPLSTLRA